GSYVKHAYDFYKPDLTSEYPLVDGQFSLQCYTEAVDQCYKTYNAREQKVKSKQSNGVNGAHKDEETPLDRFDYMCFHSPTCKLVSKSYARLLYNDFLKNPENPLFKDVPAELKDVPYEQSITDKNIEKTFVALSKKRFAARVQPTIDVPTMCGNMYTASVYSSLVSLIANVSSNDLQGKRVAMFSYGSGLASSMFSLRIRGSTEEMQSKIDLHKRLEARRTVAPEVYDEMCNLREKAHLQKNFQPAGKVEDITPGTYYLTNIDDMFRRQYEVKA
ncbi:Hydroxymethylglutaryl-CoA, partial [Hortaea werneckii]